MLIIPLVWLALRSLNVLMLFGLTSVLESNDPSILKNRDQLERFTQYISARHEQPGTPVASPATSGRDWPFLAPKR